MENKDNTRKDSIKMDEILKSLFSSSKKVLIKLLNEIFDENFQEDEVEITLANNEFIKTNLEIIRGDMFFEIDHLKQDKIYYHLEFQTINDTSMAIRMFEYGFKKAQENSIVDSTSNIRTICFPNQKVIFLEENENINESVDLRILFPGQKEFIYSVGVVKYWEFTEEELLKRKMYPLIPLQLFNLRKELRKVQEKNDIHRMHELSHIAKNLAEKLMNDSKDLFDRDEILSEDFHKMLLAIDNLISYLNRNYLKEDKLEDEVNIMIKTLYDPEVEKRGIEKGKIEGKMEEKLQNARNLLDVLDDEIIASKLDLDIEVVKSLRADMSK